MASFTSSPRALFEQRPLVQHETPNGPSAQLGLTHAVEAYSIQRVESFVGGGGGERVVDVEGDVDVDESE